MRPYGERNIREINSLYKYNSMINHWAVIDVITHLGDTDTVQSET